MGWLFIWFLCGVGAAMVASNKGNNGCLWFGIGVLLGPFGLLFAVLDQGDRVRCPACRELISSEARKCPRCQSLLVPDLGD